MSRSRQEQARSRPEHAESIARVECCEPTGGASGDGKTRRVGLSGAVASLVVAVPCVTRRVTGRFVRALGMICPRVCGGAGLAPAAGLIRSLSAVWA